MQNIIIDIVVGLCAAMLAAVQSLQFRPSAVTDFELTRRVHAGDLAARAERRLRKELPLHQALQRIVVIAVSVVITALLIAAHGVLTGIVLAGVWLLLAEVIAGRAIVVRFAEKVIVRYGSQLNIVVDSLRPVLRVVAKSRPSGSKPATRFYSKDELKMAIEKNELSPLTKSEQSFLIHAMQYGDITVRDVMTPRSAIVTVESGDTVGPVLLDFLHQSGHVRFPVIKKDLNHVVGMLYMSDLVPPQPGIKKVADAMDTNVCYVYEAKNLDHVLHAFLQTRLHLFMVVNEAEETVGLISINDILEKIIGRHIVDEFDGYQDIHAVAKLATGQKDKAESAVLTHKSSEV